MDPEKTVTVIVEQPARSVWRLITSPGKYHGLGIPHTYGPFETASGQPYEGATFKLIGLMGGRATMHVVDCVANKVLSFGSDRATWTYRFVLEDLGERTRVAFSRRFRKQGFLERLREGPQDETYLHLTSVTAGRLSAACERLRAGQPDGIFES